MRKDHPFIGFYVVIQVHFFQVIKERYIQFKSIVSPRAELQKTFLFVKREMRYVDDARRLEDGLRDPQDRAIAGHHGIRVPMLLESIVRAAKNKKVFSFMNTLSTMHSQYPPSPRNPASYF